METLLKPKKYVSSLFMDEYVSSNQWLFQITDTHLQGYTLTLINL